jgi:serine phosphatase RsbU (regulator of sigma subunit)
MLPHEPLRLGLTEAKGVSIPAREVGGDFFNYFLLSDGQIALLVGDVSGKGISAALLMANIQATLRARLPLERDLPALIDAIDKDVDANTPGFVFLTLSERLEALLARAHDEGLDDLLARVELAVKNFRGAAEPFDDATMMALRLGGIVRSA